MKTIESLDDLIPDERNANRGTDRGREAITWSLKKFGAARSVVADANGRLPAGNKTVEAARREGMEIIVVPTDGTKLVVVQRTDWDLMTDRAPREYAHADNRTNQLDYNPDPTVILQDMAAGFDLETLWNPEDLKSLLPDLRDEKKKADPEQLREYKLIFNTGEQEDAWYAFTAYLKEAFPGPVSAGLHDFLKACAEHDVFDCLKGTSGGLR